MLTSASCNWYQSFAKISSMRLALVLMALFVIFLRNPVHVSIRQITQRQEDWVKHWPVNQTDKVSKFTTTKEALAWENKANTSQIQMVDPTYKAFEFTTTKEALAWENRAKTSQIQIRHNMHVQALKSKYPKAYPALLVANGVRLHNEVCPTKHTSNTMNRLQRWNGKGHQKDYIQSTGLWQPVVNSKLAQSFFAHSLNLTHPMLYRCFTSGLDGLESFVPPAHARKGFVIKDMHGHSSKGVYIFPNGFKGKELFSGKQLAAIHVKKQLQGLGARNVMIEEYIPPQSKGLSTIDYKFHMHGSTVGAIFAYHNRGTSGECVAWYDSNWKRVDSFGCFGINSITEHLCSNNIKLDLVAMEELLKVAKIYGANLGIFYRVDLFVNPGTKQITLGEFTPWPWAGKGHCVATLDEKTNTFDGCILGRLWEVETTIGLNNRHNGSPVFEGGPGAVKPSWVDAYKAMSLTEQCDSIIEFSKRQPR